jgi:hypothetical protein
VDSEILKGIKTFIVNADVSLTFDETQLQSLFLNGFEVYNLPELRLIPLMDQIDCLVELFKELILFFNVDVPLGAKTWPVFISDVTKRHGRKVRIGVLHHEGNPKKRSDLENIYLYQIQIQAGCVYFERGKIPDMVKLRNVLVANEANGRRKAIRMMCSGRLNLEWGGRRLEAKVLEVSISHFLCVFRDGDPELKDSTRLSNVQLMIGGPVFTVDAMVLIRRLAGNSSSDMVYICGFVKPGGKQIGLGAYETDSVIRLIQHYCTERIEQILHTAFQKRWAQNTRAKRPEVAAPVHSS